MSLSAVVIDTDFACSFNPFEWVDDSPQVACRFLITDDELGEILESYLPAQFSPYQLIAYIPARGIGEPGYFKSGDMSSFSDMRRQGAITFYIQSGLLTPGFEMVTKERMDAFFMVNGLLRIQHGPRYGSRWGASFLDSIYTLRNLDTDDVCFHEEYQMIRMELQRRIEKLLTAEGLLAGSSCSEEQTERVRMSEQFSKALDQKAVESLYCLNRS